MELQRKNKQIFIDQESYGTLILIKNQILGKFDKLMNEAQAELIHKTKSYLGDPMPYAFCFAPSGKKNQECIKTLKNGEIVDLIKDGVCVGNIKTEFVYELNDKIDNIFSYQAKILGQDPKIGKFALSGEIEIFDSNFKEIKAKIFEKMETENIKKVTALMLKADPFHRLHERLVRMTIDKADLVLLFLLRTNDENQLDFELRRKTIEYFRDNFLPRDRIIIVPFENTQIFCDHNPVLECIAARNLGATKLVLGQNHKGIGMFFDENQPHTILDSYKNDLGIEIIVMPEFVYCEKCKTIVSTKTCPHGAHHHIKYNTNTLKIILKEGILPPAIFMRKEISAMILSALFPNRFENLQKIYDDMFPNSGILECHSDKEFYEELMKLYQTSSLT